MGWIDNRRRVIDRQRVRGGLRAQPYVGRVSMQATENKLLTNRCHRHCHQARIVSRLTHMAVSTSIAIQSRLMRSPCAGNRVNSNAAFGAMV